jgi:hypothetical protein
MLPLMAARRERLLPRPTTGNKKQDFYGLFGDSLETEHEMLSRIETSICRKAIDFIEF